MITSDLPTAGSALGRRPGKPGAHIRASTRLPARPVAPLQSLSRWGARPPLTGPSPRWPGLARPHHAALASNRSDTSCPRRWRSPSRGAWPAMTAGPRTRYLVGIEVPRRAA
jgi:hypothetical protein